MGKQILTHDFFYIFTCLWSRAFLYLNIRAFNFGFLSGSVNLLPKTMLTKLPPRAVRWGVHFSAVRITRNYERDENSKSLFTFSMCIVLVNMYERVHTTRIVMRMLKVTHYTCCLSKANN